MPRPAKCRRVCCQQGERLFKPQGVPMHKLETIELQLDELEALRLADHVGLHQQQAAELMGVSRATMGRILTKAHSKLARMLLENTALAIGGGNIKAEPGIFRRKRVNCHGKCHNQPDLKQSNKE